MRFFIWLFVGKRIEHIEKIPLVAQRDFITLF